LYDLKMTSVYSGGLAYEYSMEANNFGIVELDGDNVKELDDFGRLQKAFAATPNPTGDGGYNKTGGASGCPAQSKNWNVTTDALPAIPSGAKKYMTEGAGKGVGLSGKGSQTASGTSTETAEQGSGSVSGVASGSASASGNAAASFRQGPVDFSPIVISALTIGLTVFGAFLL
jgi:1,3-beta-glucanosyltransferase GAS5